jgi:hypothetical protein
VTGDWRKLYNEELHDLYSSPIIRIVKARMRWARHVARMGEKRNAYRFLVGNPEGRGPLGRPRRRWLDNVRMHLVEVGSVMRTGLIWLRIGTGGELLRIRYGTFGFHKMLGNYRVVKQLRISRVVLSSMELVMSWS